MFSKTKKLLLLFIALFGLITQVNATTTSVILEYFETADDTMEEGLPSTPITFKSLTYSSKSDSNGNTYGSFILKNANADLLHLYHEYNSIKYYSLVLEGENVIDDFLYTKNTDLDKKLIISGDGSLTIKTIRDLNHQQYDENGKALYTVKIKTIVGTGDDAHEYMQPVYIRVNENRANILYVTSYDELESYYDDIVSYITSVYSDRTVAELSEDNVELEAFCLVQSTPAAEMKDYISNHFDTELEIVYNDDKSVTLKQKETTSETEKEESTDSKVEEKEESTDSKVEEKEESTDSKVEEKEESTDSKVEEKEEINIKNNTILNSEYSVSFTSKDELDKNAVLFVEKVNDKMTEKQIKEIESKLADGTFVNIFDIKVKNGNDVVPMENGEFTIRIKLEAATLEKYNKFLVVYVTDDGEVKETFNAKVVNDNEIEFTTSHLSQYAVVGTKLNNNSEANPETGDNFGDFALLFIVSGLGLITLRTFVKKEQ